MLVWLPTDVQNRPAGSKARILATGIAAEGLPWWGNRERLEAAIEAELEAVGA